MCEAVYTIIKTEVLEAHLISALMKGTDLMTRQALETFMVRVQNRESELFKTSPGSLFEEHEVGSVTPGSPDAYEVLCRVESMAGELNIHRDLAFLFKVLESVEGIKGYMKGYTDMDVESCIEDARMYLVLLLASLLEDKSKNTDECWEKADV